MSATPPRKPPKTNKEREEQLANLEREREEAKLLKTIYNPNHPKYNANLAAIKKHVMIPPASEKERSVAAAAHAVEPKNLLKGLDMIGKADLKEWGKYLRNPQLLSYEEKVAYGLLPEPKAKSPTRKRKRSKEQEGGRRRRRAAVTRRRRV
jgi:hypothetical protein